MIHLQCDNSVLAFEPEMVNKASVWLSQGHSPFCRFLLHAGGARLDLVGGLVASS